MYLSPYTDHKVFLYLRGSKTKPAGSGRAGYNKQQCYIYDIHVIHGHVHTYASIKFKKFTISSQSKFICTCMYIYIFKRGLYYLHLGKIHTVLFLFSLIFSLPLFPFFCSIGIIEKLSRLILENMKNR